jgi:hypothetical protein
MTMMMMGRARVAVSSTIVILLLPTVMLQMFDWRLYKKAVTTMMARENPARAMVALARATMTMARENPARASVALALVRAIMMMTREIRQGKGSQ